MKTAPGVSLGRLPESAPWRLHGNHSAGQGSLELRGRVQLPASFRRLPSRHTSRVGRRRRERNCIYRRICWPAVAADPPGRLGRFDARATADPARASRSRRPVPLARPAALVLGRHPGNRTITYGDHMMAFDESRTPSCGRVVHEPWITAVTCGKLPVSRG